MEIAYGLHPLALVGDVIRAMLHFVTFEQQEPPGHRDVEINPRALPPVERGNLYRVFAGEGYLQRGEEGRKEFFVSLPTYLA